MCLIAYKKDKDSVFTNAQFYNMVGINSDGLGIMYREDGRVKFEKKLGNSKKQFEVFQKHRDREEYAMHARYKTHGRVDEANCHPYEILNMDKGDPVDMYLMHNGVINVKEDIDASMSDTWNFVEGVMKPIAKLDPNLFWENANVRNTIVKAIGNSKFLIMRSDDAPVLIINEDMGDIVQGCWLSNLHSTRNYKSKVWVNGVEQVKYEEAKDTGSVFRRPVSEPYNYTALPVKRKEEEPLNVYSGHSHRRGSWWVGKTSNVDNVSNTTHEHKTVADRVKAHRDNIAARAEKHMTEEEWEQKWMEYQIKEEKVVTIPTAAAFQHDMHTFLQLLKGMKDEDMIFHIQEEPEYTAAIIKSFYEKNTMPLETIIDHCCDKVLVKDIVKLIRSLQSKAA